MKPASLKPRRKASIRCSVCGFESELRNPTTGRLCAASAASGPGGTLSRHQPERWTRAVSFDHLVGAQQDPGRNRHPERLGGFEIDYCLECGRLLHRQISELFPLENAPDVGTDLTIGSAQARAVADQAAGDDKFAPSKHCRYRMARGQQYKLIAPAGKKLVGLHEQPADPLVDDRCERSVKLAISGDVEDAHALTELVDGGLYIAHLGLRLRASRVHQHSDKRSRGNKLVQQFLPLRCEHFGEDVDAGQIGGGSAEAGDETEINGI